MEFSLSISESVTSRMHFSQMSQSKLLLLLLTMKNWLSDEIKVFILHTQDLRYGVRLVSFNQLGGPNTAILPVIILNYSTSKNASVLIH